MTFGKRLLQLRESRSLDQIQLGEILNLSRSTISAYEQDKRSPSPDTIILIANYFKVSTDFLLKGEVKNEEDEIQSETKAFLERINKLGEKERAYLKGKVEDMIKVLEQMKNI